MTQKIHSLSSISLVYLSVCLSAPGVPQGEGEMEIGLPSQIDATAPRAGSPPQDAASLASCPPAMLTSRQGDTRGQPRTFLEARRESKKCSLRDTAALGSRQSRSNAKS